jgi:hypothetical protein
MIAHIIGCGPSGKHWNGKGFSIGVNDCLKFDHNVDILVIVNSLNSYPERKKIVEDTRPRQTLYGISCWANHPCFTPIPTMVHWRGRLDKNHKIYRSKTSPFIAASMAYSMGYDKIVLWGVDFVDHPVVKDQKLRSEVGMYVSLQNALLKKGASMYLGATNDFENEGALKGFLPNFRIA